jgi:L-lactate dehydrogenase
MGIRVGIIGIGWVGSSVALSTLLAGFANELLLSDIRPRMAEGEAMDLAHGASFYPAATVRVVNVEEMVGADAIVVAAGRGGGPEESRLELLTENAKVVRDIGLRLRGHSGMAIVVSNPVDVLTHVLAKSSGMPPERVIGTGTMLDTARLRQVIGQELRLDPRSIHAHIVGEHGDSEVVLWSGARVGGTPLREWPGWDSEREPSLAWQVRNAAHEIIRRKGATNHAIGLATAALLRWMLRGERRVVTVSRVHAEVLGVRDVALSLPSVLGTDGATRVIHPSMSIQERDGLQRSAELMRRAVESLEHSRQAAA